MKHLSNEDLIQRKKELENAVSAYDAKQMAFKIAINSLYGALGNEYFRFYSTDQAVAITSSGQSTIRWSERTVNAYLNKLVNTEGVDYVTYIDTDSCYVNLESVVDKILKKNPSLEGEYLLNTVDSFCNLLQMAIQKGYDDLFNRMNGLENRLEMKREAIGSALFYQKKRYVMSVYDNEGVRYGYDHPKLKVMGLESVRSTTPQFCRKAIDDTFKALFSGGEDSVVEMVERKKKEFRALPYHDISIPTGVSEINKFVEGSGYRKGTPSHVKAAIHYNNMIRTLGLEDKYELIKEGDKLKTLILRTPNPTNNNVIAYINYLPEEFGLTDYIDYDTTLEKTYLGPIRRVMDVIGYKTEDVANIEDFFT